MLKSDYWALWMKFLSEETFAVYDAEETSSLAVRKEDDKLHAELPTEDRHRIDSEKLGWVEKFFAKYSPTRRLRHLYFTDKVMVSGLSYHGSE